MIWISVTGQTLCFDEEGVQRNCEGTCEDGEFQTGIDSNPRFTNPDGTTPIDGEVVLDKLTGLMWTRNAQKISGKKNWSDAITACNNLAFNTSYGYYYDWRLPNVRELQSLINYGRYNPALDPGIFTNVQSSYDTDDKRDLDFYWTSTTYYCNASKGWIIGMYTGCVYQGEWKTAENYVWPVRKGPCNGDFNTDGDVDGGDLAVFIDDYGRNIYNNPCTSEDPCNGNFDCDSDVDAVNSAKFLEDYGRNIYNNPCSICTDSAGQLPETGQTASYATGDDGNLKIGVAWPNPRFTANVDNNGDGDCNDAGESCDGTVTDSLTGLMWTKEILLIATEWQDALDYVNGMRDGTYENFGYNDWRVPNIREIFSMIDFSRCQDYENNFKSVLPDGHPFYVDNISQDDFYPASSTSCAFDTTRQWGLCGNDGDIGHVPKQSEPPPYGHVWAVRSAQ
jgi:hypothetical protein